MKKASNNSCGLYFLQVLLVFTMHTHAQNNNPNTDWFKNAKYGIMVHFLPKGSAFRDYINKFDVNAFAQDCSDAGAGYVIFTLGQNSGYYNSPNATYDKYAHHTAGERCSVRDMPMELAKALHKKGISLILYIPGEPPSRDTLAALALGASQAVSNEAGVNWVYNDTLVLRWANVVQEWSDRYGSLIKGWWVDGCYEESNFKDAYAKPYLAHLNMAVQKVL